jgi:hypothetical protein
MNDLDRFYQEVCNLTEGFNGKVSHVARTVALFRVAIEFGVAHLGGNTLGYMMSRLLAVTLGVLHGSSYTNYESILEEFDPDRDHTTH